jgi:DNA-binding XRE family transcriptional regulator
MKTNKQKYLELATPLDEFEKELGITQESRKRIDERRKYYDLLSKIRELRKEEGLTQKDIANKTGMPRTAISNIEAGKKNITVNTLVTIASALGCNIEIKFIKHIH